MKTKLSIATLIVFFNLSAFSHIIPGVYKGKDTFNMSCSFEIQDTFYEQNTQHPLLERIPVKNINIDGLVLLENNIALAHPPLVDLSLGQVRFNHDLFSQIFPTTSGANAVVLEKSHVKGENGSLPTKLMVLVDYYQDQSKNQKFECIVNP